MEKYLNDYMQRISPHYRDMDKDCAHQVASTILSFKYGLYPKTLQSAERALETLPDSKPNKTLKKAITIIHDRAKNLQKSRVKEASGQPFTPDDEEYLAIVLPLESVENKEDLKLDNAMLLLYAVAYLESEEDNQSLEEHRNFVLQILGTYKEDLNP